MKLKTIVADNLPLEVKYEMIASNAPINYLLASAKKIANLPNIDPNKTIIENILDYYMKEYNDINDFIMLLGSKMFDKKILIILRSYGGYVFPCYDRHLGITADFEEVSEYICNEKTIPDYKPYHIVERFKNAYQQDNSSDAYAIELVIDSFYETLKKEPYLAIRDLRTLIDIKKEHPESCLLYDNDHLEETFTLCYNDEEMEDIYFVITISNKHSIGSFNHELTHCIHYYYNQMQTPEEFKKQDLKYETEMIDNLCQKIDEVSKEMLPSRIEMLKKFIKYIKYKKQSLKEYKKEIKKDFKKKFGTEELLNEVLSFHETDIELVEMLNIATINKQHYKDTPKNQKKLELYLNKRLLLEYIDFRNMYYDLNNLEFYSFCDFIDSYTQGELWSKKRNINENYIIQGHEKNYYTEDDRNQFAEMLAEYITLKKSSNGEKYIQTLRELFSNELLDLLDNFYKNINKKKMLVKEK